MLTFYGHVHCFVQEKAISLANTKVIIIETLSGGPSMNEGDKDQDREVQEFQGEEEILSELELNEIIQDLCLSKVEEFRMLGYEYVTGKDIWDCVSDKYRKTGSPPLHRIVNDILSLKSNQFMNWMTISVYKGAQL
jgi:hypothetical protein